MTCYVLDGSVDDLLWPCDNSTTTHTTCCPAGATCWSNGVCMDEPEDGPTDYLRAGCTDPSWEDAACLNECREFAPDNLAGIRPCDGIEESTNYCCDDGKKGKGSFHCCNDEDSIFTLGDDVPTILAEMPIAWTSAAEDMTASPGTSETASSGEDSGSANIGVPIGVGVGVGLPAAALIIGAGIFFTRRRKKAAAAGAVGLASAADAATVSQPLEPKYHPQGPQYDAQAPPVYGHQSPVYAQQSPVYAPPPPQSPVYPQHHAPVELGTSQPAKHELP